jgi:hypothetical protein
MDIPGQKKQDLIWIGLISLISLIAHYLTYNTLGFHRDEYLYLALGKHLAAGYWSNPPLIGLISYLSQLFPSNSLFSTRLFPALAGAAVVFLTGLTARELGGKTYAQVLACIALVVSILFLRAFSMLQPVPFDILIWTLILYLALRFVNTEKPVFLILMGVCFGFGVLNKYMVVFLAAGLGVAILPTPYRKLWISKYSGYAILITIVLILPNFWWQCAHGFPVIHHMRELAQNQLVNVKRLNILTDQILMFTISSFVWISGLLWLLRSRNAYKFRLFGYTYLVVLLMFLYLRGKNYYMAGLYPFLFAAGGVFWEKAIHSLKWRIAMATAIVLLSIPILPGAVPVMPAKNLAGFFSKIPPRLGGEALVRWEDGKMHPLPQDYADMQGWDELGGIVVKACDTISDKGRIMIYCENYGQAGAVGHCCGCHGLPEPVSFSDSYLMWAPDSIDNKVEVFVYVNGELGRDLDSLFSHIEKAGSITNQYSREYNTSVFVCRMPRADFRRFWADRVKEVKREAGILQ